MAAVDPTARAPMRDLDGVRVEVAQGTLVGVSDRGVEAFHGVPYAGPPTGVHRWRAARPPASWLGSRDASTPGPAALQLAGPSEPDVGRVDEDCLALSVWRPAGARGPLPVVVWVHGGAFEKGRGVSPSSAPHRLVASGDMVVVAPNYRLGALGFAHLAHNGGPFADASNLGLRDVIAALGWVRDNIAQLQGDPKNVTVMGHSAGAFLTAALPAAPAATGLFHRLVLSSGAASRVIPLAAAEEMGTRVLHELGRILGTRDLAALAAAPGEAILQAQARVVASDLGLRNAPVPQAFSIVHDGETVAEHPLRAIGAGSTREMPLMLGATQHEAAYFAAVSDGFASAGIDGIVDEVHGWGVEPERARTIVDAYRRPGATAEQVRASVLSDWVYRLPVARLAAAHRDRGGSAWLYTVEDADCLGVAAHNIDVPLLFGTSNDERVPRQRRYPPGGHAARDAISVDLQQRLRAFVHGGDPPWEAYDSAGGPALCVGDATVIRPDPFRDVLDIWAGVPRP